MARAGILVGAALSFSLALMSAGCNNGDDERVLQVFAASSLTDAFREAEAVFEAAHPGVDVRISTAGSQILRLQIEQGAKADVFASANLEHMERLRRAGVANEPTTLGHNALVVIVPEANPARVERLEDLPRAQRVVVGEPSSPVGAYTERFLEAASETFGAPFAEQVRAHVVSTEHNVRLVRAKTEVGEADAAVVYRTDAATSKRLRTIEIPAGLSPEVRYLITTLAHASQPDLARAFVDFLTAGPGRAVLVEHGFVEGGR